MHEHSAFILGMLLVFIYGLFSRLSERSVITGPMFVVAVGLLVSPLGLNLFEAHIGAGLVTTIAEIALILILFVDASQIRISDIRKSSPRLALRLLGIGLPLCIGLGLLFAALLFPTMNIWMLAILALILAPTDAALGQAVVKSEKVPAPIRRAISIESGLNDGIVLPILLFCIAIAANGTSAIDGQGTWLIFLAKQLTIGPAVGALVGWAGGLAVQKASDRGWMEAPFQGLACFSLAILAYSLAEILGGNGFIGAFFGGLFLGVKSLGIREKIQEFGESEGQLLTLFVFFLFGLVMVPAAADLWNWQTLIYAILSLTFIRMAPAALSLWRSGLSSPQILYVAWFGPRGIASILYALIFIGELGVENYRPMLSVVALTVLLSVILHGATAVPFSNALNRGIPPNRPAHSR